MPDLQLFHNEFKDRVTLIGIDIGQYTGLGSQNDARDLLNQLEITYPAGFTDDASVLQRYEVLAMPTTMFITPKGEVFRKWSGLTNKDIVVKIVEEMLYSLQNPAPTSTATFVPTATLTPIPIPTPTPTAVPAPTPTSTPQPTMVYASFQVTFVTTWGTSGSGEGEFDFPWGIAVDAQGNVYVVDRFINRVQKFSVQLPTP
jgi:hypothetical protein